MQKTLTTFIMACALTIGAVPTLAQNKGTSKDYLHKQTTESMPTETLMRNTPHSLSGTQELTHLTGVLKDIYVENWGELVLLEAGNTALYNDASMRSAIMETSKGYLSIAGPVVLPCVGRKNGWFAVEHPTENVVGWVSGNHVRMAGQTGITEQQQNRMYRVGEWEMLCVAVNKATGLALGYIQRRRQAQTDGKPLRQVMMGKVVDGAYVFHYFVEVNIIRRYREHSDAFTAVKPEGSKAFDIHVGMDWLIPKYSHLNMIDFQRLPARVVEHLFGEAIKEEADPLDAHTYLFVTNELLCKENEDWGIH